MTAENLVDDWSQARESHQLVLFRGEQSLAALALRTNISGIYPPEVRAREEDLRHTVQQIIDAHDRNADTRNTSGDGNALFQLAAPDDRPIVGAITREVIHRWERACWRAKKTSPFARIRSDDPSITDFGREDVQLVIETAAGVLDVLQFGYPKPRPESQRFADTVNIIAQHGPEFAQRWLRGDYIKEYCEHHGLNAPYWLRLLSDWSRIKIIMDAPSDPFSRLENFANRFQQTAPQLLAEQLPIDVATATRLFTPSIRVNLAFGKNPVDAIRAALEEFNTTCSPEQIAAELGCTAEDAKNMFTEKQRMKLALMKNPMREAKRVAALWRNLQANFELPDSIIHELSTFPAQKAMRLARTLQESKAQCPPTVSMNMWLWAVLKYPEDTDQDRELRRTYLQSFAVAHNVSPGSGHTPPSGNRQSLPAREVPKSLLQEWGIKHTPEEILDSWRPLVDMQTSYILNSGMSGATAYAMAFYMKTSVAEIEAAIDRIDPGDTPSSYATIGGRQEATYTTSMLTAIRHQLAGVLLEEFQKIYQLNDRQLENARQYLQDKGYSIFESELGDFCSPAAFQMLCDDMITFLQPES